LDKKTTKMANRSSNIQFSNEEKPPLLSIAVLALQHSAIVLINLVYVVIIAKALDLPPATQLAVISTTLLVCGIGTALQARFGSGLLIVFHPNPIYIPLIITAGQAYGPSGIAVLVASAGVCQFFFGSAVRKLRVLFPPEVCGVVVIMLGVSLLPGTLRGIVTSTSPSESGLVDTFGLFIAIVTLAVASASSVWLRGTARYFSLLLGCVSGIFVAYLAGYIPTAQTMSGSSGSYFAIPTLSFPGFEFDSGLFLIAAVAALVNVVDELGVLIGTERLDDPDWRKPDFNKVTRGLQTSGLLTTLSGALGGVALGMSSANLSLAYATGVTSRVVAIAAGGFLVVVAFLPFLLNVVLSMPNAVLAGLLFYSAAYFIVSGAELALSRMMSPRRALVIGLSVSVGVILQTVPVLSDQADGTLFEHVLSPMTFATILAIGLNLLMRIGIKQKDRFIINAQTDGDDISEKLESLGESWGLHRATVARARATVSEIAEIVVALAEEDVVCIFEHDELYLSITLTYRGRVILTPDAAPTADELINNPDGVAQMSAWIIKRLSDRVTFSSSGSNQVVRLVFEC
jgi:xanthine permease XanP